MTFGEKVFLDYVMYQIESSCMVMLVMMILFPRVSEMEPLQMTFARACRIYNHISVYGVDPRQSID